MVGLKRRQVGLEVSDKLLATCSDIGALIERLPLGSSSDFGARKTKHPGPSNQAYPCGTGSLPRDAGRPLRRRRLGFVARNPRQNRSRRALRDRCGGRQSCAGVENITLGSLPRGYRFATQATVQIRASPPTRRSKFSACYFKKVACNNQTSLARLLSWHQFDAMLFCSREEM